MLPSTLHATIVHLITSFLSITSFLLFPFRVSQVSKAKISLITAIQQTSHTKGVLLKHIVCV